MLGLGDTVLLKKPRQETAHLWAIVTAANPQTDEVIIVNFTTQRPDSDTTVVIQPGEHRFVKHPTVAFFADARTSKLADLQDATVWGQAHQDDPLTPELLRRVQEGLLASQMTPKKIKAAFQEAKNQGRA
jgi:hypothetical protein